MTVITIQDFQRAISSRAEKNKIKLPIHLDTTSQYKESIHEGSPADIHQNIDLDYRRKHGQFFTPPDVAEFMVKYGIDGKIKTMLDPSCGLGIFIEKMIKLHGKKCENIIGIDKDPTMINACYLDIMTHHQDQIDNVKLYNTDYLLARDTEKVDFLICNPPYINFHGFDRDMISKIKHDFGVNFSMLTNIYTLFMVKAKQSVKEGGRIAFITPTEFFYTGYGKTLKKFLLDNFTIDSFITFNFENTVFDDALTTSTISFMVNKKPKDNHQVKFIKTGGYLNGLLKMSRSSKRYGVHINKVRQKTVNPDIKWQKYFADANSKSVIKGFVPLRDIAYVKRGIATGYNTFFTLSDAEREYWGIESDFLVPVISKAVQIQGYEITNDIIVKLGKHGDKIHLLYCFDTPSYHLKKYIKYGESKGVNGRYLCSHRTPWYSMERRKSAPILSTVFSRNNMRFIHNKSNCLNLAAYHGVYPHFEDNIMTEALLCYFNSDLCMDIQKQARREYGNGLHKFEPGDLLDLPTMPIMDIGKKDISKMALLFRRMTKSKTKDSIKEKINNTIEEIALSLCPKYGKD